MTTIKGVWLFNEVLDMTLMEKHGMAYPPAGFAANFTSNGVQCASFAFNCGVVHYCDYVYDYYSTEDLPNDDDIVYDFNGIWADTAFRTIDFGNTEQTIDDELYNWLTTNATEQSDYEPIYFIEPETLVGIGDAIREKTGTNTKYTSAQIADGVNEVFEAGKQAEYDRFWDAYQDNGNRTQYAHAFRGSGWTDATFKPKYDIVCNEWDNYLFSGSRIVDIKGILESQGVTLDTSKVSGLTYFFQNCSATVRIPALDMRSCASAVGLFYYCSSLQEIEMNNVREDLTGSNMFVNCTALTTVKITGTIGTSVFNLSDSPLLTNESVQSIIDCLKDLTVETTQTVKFHADVGAKMTEEQKATITAKNWTLVY